MKAMRKRRAHWTRFALVVAGAALGSLPATGAHAAAGGHHSITYYDSQVGDTSGEFTGAFECTLGRTYVVDISVDQRQRKNVSEGEGTAVTVCTAPTTNFDVFVQLLDGPPFVQRIARVDIVVTDQTTGAVTEAVFHKRLNE